MHVKTLMGHKDGVFCLRFDDVNGRLFSGAGDGTVKIWDTEDLQLLSTVRVASNPGDILCLAWSKSNNMVYLGCQDTSIQVS